MVAQLLVPACYSGEIPHPPRLVDHVSHQKLDSQSGSLEQQLCNGVIICKGFNPLTHYVDSFKVLKLSYLIIWKTCALLSEGAHQIENFIFTFKVNSDTS